MAAGRSDRAVLSSDLWTEPGPGGLAVWPRFPPDERQKHLWLRCNAARLTTGGMSEARTSSGITAIKNRLPALEPEENAKPLSAAGFVAAQFFYDI